MELCKTNSHQRHRHMNVHNNARLLPRSRAAMVDAVVNQRLTWKEAAASFHVSERTVAKWVGRYRKEGIQFSQRTNPSPPDKPLPPPSSTTSRPSTTAAAVIAPSITSRPKPSSINTSKT